MLIALGPAVCSALWLLFQRTRWGIPGARGDCRTGRWWRRSASDQKWLFTSVFVLGAFSPAWAARCRSARRGAPRDGPADHRRAFVVVVIGGLGSVSGAYLAAVLLGVLNAFGIVVFPQISLVLASWSWRWCWWSVRGACSAGRSRCARRRRGLGHGPADDARPAR